MKAIFTRSKLNPIIKPKPGSLWRSLKTYNPGALWEDGHYHIFYRALGRAYVSKIGYGRSRDGENFKMATKPMLDPEIRAEKNGLEDPRITKINGKYLLTYTAYDGECARLNWASSLDLISWQKHGGMLADWDAQKAGGFPVPWDHAQNNKNARRSWHKAGGIFPEKFQGKLRMIFGDRHLWTAGSKDEKTWSADIKPWLSPRPGYFDAVHVEMGPPPIKTESGWLVLYHGIDEKKVYRLGFLLLDLDEPSRIIKRSCRAIFEPSMPYELSGPVDIIPGGLAAMETMEKEELDEYIKKAVHDHSLPCVVFCNGAVLKNGVLRIFYGAGDSVIGTATAELKDILSAD